MCRATQWRAGASQPSRATSPIFLSYVALPYIYLPTKLLRAVLFYSHNMCLAHAQITTRGFSCSMYIPQCQVCVLLVVGLRFTGYTAALCTTSGSFACCWLAYTSNNLYCISLLNSSIILCRTFSWITPAHQQCSTFC